MVEAVPHHIDMQSVMEQRINKWVPPRLLVDGHESSDGYPNIADCADQGDAV